MEWRLAPRCALATPRRRDYRRFIASVYTAVKSLLRRDSREKKHDASTRKKVFWFSTEGNSSGNNLLGRENSETSPPENIINNNARQAPLNLSPLVWKFFLYSLKSPKYILDAIIVIVSIRVYVGVYQEKERKVEKDRDKKRGKNEKERTRRSRGWTERHAEEKRRPLSLPRLREHGGEVISDSMPRGTRAPTTAILVSAMFIERPWAYCTYTFSFLSSITLSYRYSYEVIERLCLLDRQSEPPYC